MTSKKKNVGAAPNMDDLSTALAGRYTEHTSSTERTSASHRTSSTGDTSADSAKVRRSWLLPRSVADELATAADELHHESRGRVGKSEAQAALIAAGLRHIAEARVALGLDSTDTHSSHPSHE